jgi:hypothetical protein
LTKNRLDESLLWVKWKFIIFRNWEFAACNEKKQKRVPKTSPIPVVSLLVIVLNNPLKSNLKSIWNHIPKKTKDVLPI